MARPKKTPPLSDFLDAPATKEELELDEFLEEIGPSTAVIHILRMKPDGSRPQLGKTTMEQLREDPWEFLRASYGAGKYMLLFKGSDRRIAGSKMFEVEGVSATPAATPATNGNGSQFNGLFPPEMSFQDKMLMMRFFMPEKPAIDFGAIMAGMGAMMTALRPVEGAKPADPMEMFKTAMSLFQGINKPEKSSIEQLREVAGVIKEFSGDSKESSAVDSPWGMVTEIGKQVVDKIGPAFTGMMAPGGPAARSVQAIPPQPGRGPAVAALPAVGGPATAPNPPAASVEENIQRWLSTQIAYLKEKAKAGKDPGFWIDFVFENAEEPGCQALLYTMRRGATFENLLEFDPEIAQNPQISLWFKEVFEGVRAGLLQGDVDSGGQGGDARNAAPNVPSSTTGQPNAGGPGSSTVVPVSD